jgi:hypothetical protein
MGLRAWWRRKFGNNVRTFTDEQTVEAYVMAGAEMGSAVSYIYMGECIGFDKLLGQWEATEKAYVDLGFRTLSIDDFVRYGGYAASIDKLLRVPRKRNEKPVYHAAYYRERFFEKVGMSGAVVKALHGEAAVGCYVRPSTDHLKE